MFFGNCIFTFCWVYALIDSIFSIVIDPKYCCKVARHMWRVIFFYLYKTILNVGLFHSSKYVSLISLVVPTLGHVYCPAGFNALMAALTGLSLVNSVCNFLFCRGLRKRYFLFGIWFHELHPKNHQIYLCLHLCILSFVIVYLKYKVKIINQIDM